MNITPSPYWQFLAPGMFPMYEEALSALTVAHKRLICVLDYLKIEEWNESCNWVSRGRPKINRSIFLKAFIAKHTLSIPSVVGLIDRLKVDKTLRRIIGIFSTNRVPCEATFSNAFAEFARTQICQRVHEELVIEELKNDLIFHISRDSTAISARETPLKKEKPILMPKKMRGRPKTGEVKASKSLTRIERQALQSLQQMTLELKGNADFGAKVDSKGNNHVWAGYKLHMDVADGGIPVSCLVSPASVHDSGASIPLQIMTRSRVNCLYILADKAYDSNAIRNHISKTGSVSIIPERTRKNGETKLLESFEKNRFKERATAERANSRLKDSLGAKNFYYRGFEKVSCHLMFGVLVLFSEAIARLM